jgi:hypothetical protein
MKHSIEGPVIYLVVGPLSIYVWQPTRRWYLGRMDCPAWCCRWNAYAGPLGLEWAISADAADKIIDSTFEQELAKVFIDGEGVNGVDMHRLPDGVDS